MSIFDQLPPEFTPIVILGEIDGYLHVFSKQEDDVVFTLLSMALDAMESKEYDESIRFLQ